MLNAETVTEAGWGYSFEKPEGWKYSKGIGGAILGHDSITGAIFVYPHQFNSLDTLQLQMRNGVEERIYSLKPASDPVPFDKNGFIVDYTGFWGYQKAKAKAIGTLSPSGNGGAIVLALTKPQMFSKQLIDTAIEIAESIHYSHNDDANLKQNFVGKWNTSSKNRESHLYLYPDGTYLDSESSSYSNSDQSLGSTWGMAGDNNRRGYWEVKGTLSKGRLITTDYNGKSYVYEYNVHTENGQEYHNEYFINGVLYSKSTLQ